MSATRKPEVKCPLELTLAVLSGKWKAPIIWNLHRASRPLRFAEIKRAIPAITQRMLSRQLRDLETQGIVSRHVHQTAPPWVEYALTDNGKTLQPILDAMREWGETNGSLP